MKIKNLCCFKVGIQFMKNDYTLAPNSWEVSDLLSSISFLPPGHGKTITCTSDPAYWYDWKELIEEELSNDQLILDEKNGLTLEQGLVAIQYFLEQKYWIKNKDMLLKDAYADLVAEYTANKDNLESSKLWQEWLIAVQEGKKFDKVFKDDIES
jgi:hypothetical protein